MSIDNKRRNIDSDNVHEHITLDQIKILAQKHKINMNEFMKWFQIAVKMGIFRQIGHDLYVFSSQEMKLAMVIKTQQLKQHKKKEELHHE